MRALRNSLAALALVALTVGTADARDPKAVRAFKRTHPCPATGKAGGKCPGYVVDHIVPLCAGGADAPVNMQWQTYSDAKIKDLAEKRQCAVKRWNR